MLLGVVSLSDIIDIDLTRAISVHDFVGLLADGNSGGVHLSSDGSEELVV